MKINWLIAPLAAAALVVAGCAGDDTEPTDDTTPSAAVSEPEPSDDPEPAPEPSEDVESEPAEETPGGDAGADERAAAAVDAFIAQHEGAERLDASELDLSEVPESDGTDVEILPEECAAAMEASTLTDLTADVASDGAMQLDMETFASKSIVVMDFDDAGTAEAAMAAMSENSSLCPEMSITIQGITTQFKSEVQDISIDGADSAMLQISTAGEGEFASTTYGVYALTGDLLINTASVGPEGVAGPDVSQALAADALAAIG